METVNAQELKQIMLQAHSLGYDAYQAADEDETPEAAIEQAGNDTLTRLIAALGQEPIKRLFVVNFFRGWRFAETDQRRYEEVVIE